MTSPDPEMPATLFRSRAGWAEELHLFPRDEIGQGKLFRMVRIALSDPDENYWAYAIVAADQTFEGNAICELGRKLGLAR